MNLKYLKHFEDVYYDKTPIYETDEERNERIQKWVDDFVEYRVGLDTVDVGVSNDGISILYKEKERWENRNIKDEKLMIKSKKEWKEMGEEMMKNMKYDLDLDLDLDDYTIVASPNGYYVDCIFPRKVNESTTDIDINKISRLLSETFYPNESKNTYPIKCTGFTDEGQDLEVYFVIWDESKNVYTEHEAVNTMIIPKYILY